MLFPQGITHPLLAQMPAQMAIIVLLSVVAQRLLPYRRPQLDLTPKQLYSVD
ncbi:hypothetical protein D3C73_467070 [compost metagenome]